MTDVVEKLPFYETVKYLNTCTFKCDSVVYFGMKGEVRYARKENILNFTVN